MMVPTQSALNNSLTYLLASPFNIILMQQKKLVSSERLYLYSLNHLSRRENFASEDRKYAEGVKVEP